MLCVSTCASTSPSSRRRESYRAEALGVVSSQPDPDAFAALLCDWCLEVEPAQQVLIASTTLAEPLITALHGAILDRQAWPLQLLDRPDPVRRVVDRL